MTRHPFEGRLGKWPDERLGVILKKRVAAQAAYFPDQIRMDLAHTVMLAEQDILDASEAAAILTVLLELREDGADELITDSPRSSLFWYVEQALISRLGEDVGGKMHTGRSHNDIMPTVSRLRARGFVLELLREIAALQTVLLRVGRNHATTVMPGYTALQHGQPWTFGHYLVGWVDAFSRDAARLRAAYERTNMSPLGASALAGTSWPLDRTRTAELLGFDAVLVNSRDAGFATRDYVAEILAAVAIAMGNLDRMCSDLFLWTSYEFGMLEIADGFAGTSSFMPQKKNAWAFDWARGAAGITAAALAASLSAHRGSSSTDGSFQDYPEKPLREAVESALDFIRLTAGAVDTIRVNEEVMRQRARANWTTASNLADTIARQAGLSFRAAHGIVGRVVRDASAAGVDPMDLTSDAVDAAAIEVTGNPVGLTDQEVRSSLSPDDFIASRVTLGSVNPVEVTRMLDTGRAHVAEIVRWIDDRESALGVADRGLMLEVDRWVHRQSA